MDILSRHLNSLFTPAPRRERKPVIHEVDGIAITKVNGLWTATVDGRTYRNSHLGDLKDQVRDILVG